MYDPSSSGSTLLTRYWFPVPARLSPFRSQVMVAGGLDSGLHSKMAVWPLRAYTVLGGTMNRGATRFVRKIKWKLEISVTSPVKVVPTCASNEEEHVSS